MDIFQGEGGQTLCPQGNFSFEQVPVRESKEENDLNILTAI